MNAHTARTDSRTRMKQSVIRTRFILGAIHGHVQLSLTTAMRSTTLQAHQECWTLVDTAVTSFSAMGDQHRAAMFER